MISDHKLTLLMNVGKHFSDNCFIVLQLTDGSFMTAIESMNIKVTIFSNTC